MIRLYLELLASFISKFQRGGDSVSVARFRGAVALSCVLLMNILTVVLFIYGLSGHTEMADVLTNKLIYALLLGGILAFNWKMSAYVTSEQNAMRSVEEQGSGIPNYLVYSIVSFALFIVGGVLTLGRMR